VKDQRPTLKNARILQSGARMTSDMTEVDARAAIAREPKKYNSPIVARTKKQAFWAITLPGNRSFFASRQQGAEI
jgi:hypothetical protein